jgi:hypothetical protein
MYTLNNDIKPACHVFTGKPRDLGRQYGLECKENIMFNESLLNWVGYGNNVRNSQKDPKFLKWMRRREEIIGDNWPDVLEEMRGVAEGSGMNYIDLLCLNLRAWWYNSEELVREWGMVPPQEEGQKIGDTQCSCVVATLADGSIAAGGGMDDGISIYCGPVKFCPEAGFRYITFPIAGTIWGNIGMNNEGLCIRSSSDSFRQKEVVTLERDACEFDDLNFDIIQGAILRTCRTVDEARTMCYKFPHNGNIMCVDAKGGVMAMQNTPGGSVEVPFQGFQCVTNHLIDDEDLFRLYDAMKVVEISFPLPIPSSRIRRGNVMNFLRKTSGRLTSEELVNFLGTRDDHIPQMTVHNNSTMAVGYNEPQKFKNVIWFLQPQAKIHNDKFLRFEV